MAIVFEQAKKPVPWVKILFVVFSVVFVAGGAYYLFFAPTPPIDVVLPEPLERASQISNLQFIDPGEVINDQVFQNLQSYFGSPGVGFLGRQNPFSSF